jgi:hypothetical protein
MHHKDYKLINVWLKDLREKGYAEWIYSTDFVEKTKPAVYYLGLNGVRYLKTLDTYRIGELRKRYREKSRSQTYVDRCVLLADCCIALAKGKEGVSYCYETEADYLEPGSRYHFIADSELIHPHLYFSKDTGDGTLTRYLLEVFDPTLPRYRVKKRLKDYVHYLDEDGLIWKRHTGTKKMPAILFICPRTTDLIYAKRRTRTLLKEMREYGSETGQDIRFATQEEVSAYSVVGQIWEAA